MRSLSKEAEQKLISAIEKAAAYVNGGMTPNDAIVKSAAAANIPAGHINLMVHAYNTGRTTTQREQGEDTLEKAADFQLADAETVLATLYPKTVKTSAEIARQDVVSTDYAISPTGMLARRRAELDKAAAAVVALPEKTYVPYPRDEKAAAEKAYSEKRAAKLAAEERRRQTTAAYTKAAAALDSLAEYFRHPGNMSFNDAVRQVGLRFGDEGLSVLDKVAAVYPQFKKQAATKNDHFGDNPLYGLVQNVLSLTEEYVTAKTASDADTPIVEKKAEQAVITGSILYDPLTEPLELAAPFVVKKAAKDPAKDSGGVGGFVGNVLKSVKTPVTAVGEQVGTAGVTTPGGMARNILQLDKDPSTIRQQEYKNITAPDHELALKNIRAQATLHDLMLNDQVISGYSPQDVALAFNEIADAAPNVVQSPAVLQAMLRKRLEAGQLADFDARQLIEMDKIKADRDYKMLEMQKLEQELA